MTISDLSCVSSNGNRLYGAAAVSYRIFRPEETYSEAERKADQLALRKLIEECGYAHFDDRGHHTKRGNRWQRLPLFPLFQIVQYSANGVKNIIIPESRWRRFRKH